MEFSIAELLATFTDDKLIAPKVLEKKLNCPDEVTAYKLQIALDALEKVGVLAKDRGRYRRNPEEQLVEGKLRCSSKGFCFAIQDTEESEDIYIRESHLSSAWNGDRVLVKVTKEGSRRRSPEGEVRVILERANTSVLARVKREEDVFRAVPLDDRLLFELDLQDNGVDLAAAIDHLVHVEIKRYPLGQHPPIGRVTQVLGSDAQSAADTDIVCCKYDLPRSFSAAVIAEAEAALATDLVAQAGDRLDLRHLLTITIPTTDTTQALDTDDAITLVQIEDGQWQLGIHIADVSQVVQPDSALDREAQKRGTSIYLGDLTLPLLPEAVSRCCAFLPGHDRLALSVLFTLDDNANILEFEIQPTLVQVDYSLSYQTVQALLVQAGYLQDETLDHSALDSALPQDAKLVDLLGHLFRLSQGIHRQRHDRGAFDLNLPDTRFHYDDEGVLGAVIVSSAMAARPMILELMILANQAVASHLRALGVPGIYRVHPTPIYADVQELMKLISNMGIDLELVQEEAIQPVDYQNFTRQFAESRAEKVLTYLLLETLKPATYSTTPRPHFGLALEQGYTHFTAPLRRYPDLLVHRVLHAVFREGRDRKSSRAKESVNLHHSSCHGKISWNVLPPDSQEVFESQFASLASHLTEQEKVAQEAEDDLEGLKKAGFMQAHTGEIFQGLITGVQSYGFFVELEDMLVEGLVHVSSLKDDWYEYRSRQQRLVGRKNRRQFRLGDRVEVQVKSVDYYRQQIDLVAVGGGSEASDDDLDLEEGLPLDGED